MAYKYYDEKPKRLDKLSQSDHEDLLRDLINAFSLLKTPTEAALFVQDLLTEREVTNLSKRLRIAKLFLEGKKYEEIEKELHTSHGTVAKIGTWLAEKGGGFRMIIKRLPKKQKVKDWREYSQWDKLKRRYPSHFWPELLLEEIVRSANKKEKERLSNVLKNLGQKSSMHKKLQEILNEEYREKHSAKKKAKIRTQGLKS
jgi:uncharacterized protein YerC